jgi:uncharacterized protein (TIGR03435 family)
MAHCLTLAVLAFVVSLPGTPCADAQSPAPRPKFEVASVKHNISGSDKAYLQATPGRLAITNVTLKRLILNAWDLQDYQLYGDPSWIASEHYDIQARPEGNPSVQQMEGPMLQALLEVRFKLVIHRETRQLPVYELTIARGGAKLQRAKEGGCTPYPADSPPPSTAAPGEVRPRYCGFSRTGEATGVSIPQLATVLSRQYIPSGLHRPIVDRTGLTGTFDFHLEWTPDLATVPQSDDAAGPSIFTALQEQLGLKLESAKGPVEVLVIDHVEPLSEN